MTEQTQPTDAEIKELIPDGEEWKYGVGFSEAIRFARAVLAKRGTPAGEGEPFGYFHQLLNHEGNGNGVWLGAAERKVVEQAHVPGETSEEIVTLYTTPQPTQAQAGAVPLKYARLHAISLDYSDSEDECTGFRDGWRAAEKHHGIKGADHDS